MMNVKDVAKVLIKEVVRMEQEKKFKTECFLTAENGKEIFAFDEKTVSTMLFFMQKEALEKTSEPLFKESMYADYERLIVIDEMDNFTFTSEDLEKDIEMSEEEYAIIKDTIRKYGILNKLFLTDMLYETPAFVDNLRNNIHTLIMLKDLKASSKEKPKRVSVFSKINGVFNA